MTLAFTLLALALGQAPQFKPGWGDGTYCGGYQQGYKAGWCSENQGICPAPPPPPCPPPIPGRTGYGDAQYRGYEDGVRAKAKLPKAGATFKWF